MTLSFRLNKVVFIFFLISVQLRFPFANCVCGAHKQRVNQPSNSFLTELGASLCFSFILFQPNSQNALKSLKWKWNISELYGNTCFLIFHHRFSFSELFLLVILLIQRLLASQVDQKCQSNNFHIQKNANHTLFMQLYKYIKMHERSMISNFSYMEIL